MSKLVMNFYFYQIPLMNHIEKIELIMEVA